jgi:GTP-binding protein
LDLTEASVAPTPGSIAPEPASVYPPAEPIDPAVERIDSTEATIEPVPEPIDPEVELFAGSAERVPVVDTTPMVAIIGRPNVGKSSLFNRILSRRHAIVSEVAGTTRDRLISSASWKGRNFLLVDTGGLEDDPEGHIPQRVQQQADMAMGAADVIVFLTDAVQGLTATDQAVAQRLRRTDKPVMLAVNKVDNDNRELAASEFYQLGIEDTAFVSAYHNYGIYDLLERLVELLPTRELADQWDDDNPDAVNFADDWEDFDDTGGPEEELSPPATELRLSIVGRTNVGKSLLTNVILGEERSIVSPVAGTTRDALDTPISYRGHTITLVDTAGIRRPGQVQRGIERYSVLRAVNAVNRSDITLLITDATELATAQDAHIAGLAWDTNRGLIVVVNKWDLVNRNRYRMERSLHRVRERLHFMPYVPVCFTSALTGEGIDELLDATLSLWLERQKRVPFRQLQYLLADAVSTHSPPSRGGNLRNRLRIRRVRQVGVNPPTFVFSVNDPKLLHFSYERYLENQIRERFEFHRTHLRLVFRREREERSRRAPVRGRSR